MKPTPNTRTVPPLPLRGYMWRTDELLRFGLNSRKIKALVDTGELHRMRYGCYIRAKMWNEFGPRRQARERIVAHAHGTLTTSTGGFVYSHLSAARLHGLFVWGVDDKVHILHPARPSSDRWGKDVRGHTESFTEDDVVPVQGLRATTLERTIFDSARMLNYPKALVIMDHGLRVGADRNTVASLAAASAGKRGIRTLRKALDHADPRSESAGETLTRELMQRLRIKPPQPQFEVQSRLGRHRMDFAWEEEKLALEFDGRTKYFDFNPTEEVIFQERRREKALVEEGWRFIRIEWKDLFQERAFKERILRALG
ncbi:type IV toxin-antitoxin system AbiEi family antitoxin domain-containing protein [Paenarthrobacter sp. CM16]|uniref:type IV toxin-antitoxin system AbiEi family antitoxin domain-containing protein n=1 Tax=Paenarthrobacter sp. CM16 TaxID=2738447 RepID=UPI001556AB9A|nr:type IV toxin-antitoxin system AbiEi family antitoxin domain-containing protein [Paenarthrobacter sp. CM16]NQD88993.1 type IV toxin-antitoxin system AbiEi family antitoxin domain-containing protein [Paenarthrobacter sp. CM16]